MISPEPLDGVFQALANPTRRSVLERLGEGPATVSELARPFDMALPSFLQHLRVLESSGLVHSRKRGRVRIVRIETASFRRAADWLGRQHRVWEQRLNQLDVYVTTMENSPDD
jgi:DNA-binding transcriptional ArsR family regulator